MINIKKFVLLLIGSLLIAFNTIAKEDVINTNADNILQNYTKNGLKYFSKGHSKAEGLNIEIKFPSEWQAKEGNRPHIVQKFVSKDDPCTCNLLVKNTPETFSSKEWEEMIQDTEGVKNVLFSDIETKDIKVTPTKYSGIPGVLSEVVYKGEQAGITIFFNGISHILFFKDKMISLDCAVGTPKQEVSSELMKKYYSVFRKMGNDIILHNKYTEEDAEESVQKPTKIENNNLISNVSPLIILIFAYGLGLLVPLIIRFACKKRLPKSLSFLIVFSLMLVQFVIIESFTSDYENNKYLGLLVAAFIGYGIIVEKEDSKVIETSKEDKESKKEDKENKIITENTNEKCDKFPLSRLLVASFLGALLAYVSSANMKFIEHEVFYTVSYTRMFIISLLMCSVPMSIAYLRKIQKREIVYWLSFLGLICPFGLVILVIALVISIFGKKQSTVENITGKKADE